MLQMVHSGDNEQDDCFQRLRDELLMISHIMTPSAPQSSYFGVVRRPSYVQRQSLLIMFTTSNILQSIPRLCAERGVFGETAGPSLPELP